MTETTKAKTYEPPLAQGESELINAVLDEMTEAFEYGELEAVDELLRFCPRINLIQYLPEEQWDKFMTDEERNVIYNNSSFQADMDAQDSKWGKNKI